jgi:hypothetical protein
VNSRDAKKRALVPLSLWICATGLASFSRRGSPTTLWLLRPRQCVRVAVRDLPLPILAAIDLRHPERVLPGLAVDGGPRVLVADGVGHVPVHVGGDDVV